MNDFIINNLSYIELAASLFGLVYVVFEVLQKNFVGGSTGEEMLVGSVVNTLTEFPEIQKVQILVDGQEVETLSGHMDLSQPLPRMTELLK